MKHFVDAYIAELNLWNKTHKLVGAKSAKDLFNESLVALDGSEANRSCFVDIGAGSGILGFAWWSRTVNSDKFLVLVEPDKKKYAFLVNVRSKLLSNSPNVRILNECFESVPRETIDGCSKSSDRIFAARAFSGALTFKECAERSAFSDEKENFFTFEAGPNGPAAKSFVLKAVF